MSAQTIKSSSRYYGYGSERLHRILNENNEAAPEMVLQAVKRQIGGLGIYMVKKSMDEVSYQYTDGKNVLKIRKNL